jgi:hypothetical protein
VLILAAAALTVAFVGFALTGPQVAGLAVFFCLTGLGIGFAETAENASIAALAPVEIRGPAFGALATVCVPETRIREFASEQRKLFCRLAPFLLG